MAHGHGHGHEPEENPVYGIIAEFDDPDRLIDAASATTKAGYKNFDAYSPFPIHGLAEAMHFEDPRVPWMAFFGGITGCLLGFGMQYFIATIDYPWNVGGKPTVSWPQFVPITFEATVLLTGLTTFVSQFAMNGLPRPHNPIFNAPNFDRASQDRFFLCIETDDPQFSESETPAFLRGLGALSVAEVAR
jgi:hypothetical protein